jgi:hypothetical protein
MRARNPQWVTDHEPAWIDDSEHVRFTHHCTTGPVEAVLSNVDFSIVTAEPLCVAPPFRCERCLRGGVVMMGRVLPLRHGL